MENKYNIHLYRSLIMGFITVHIKGVNTKRQIRLCSTAVSAELLTPDYFLPDVFQSVESFIQSIIFLCKMETDKVVNILTEKA